MLFPPLRSIATVLHRVGIHFNEFAFQGRIVLHGLVAHPFSLNPCSFFSLPYFPALSIFDLPWDNFYFIEQCGGKKLLYASSFSS